MDKKLAICFDGGGLRGYLSISLFVKIYEAFPSIIEKTTIFAGTSTGSFIAAGLAAGRSPQEIKQFYLDYSKQIFADSLWDNIKDFGRLFGAMYDNKPLKQSLETIFDKLTIGRLKKDVLLPAYNFNEGQAHYFDHTDKDTTLVEACMASSAIPLYFPVHRDKEGTHWLDGGVAANNPSMCAIAQLLNFKQRYNHTELEDIVVLSIGTGFVKKPKINFANLDLGGFQWLKRRDLLARILLEAPNESINYQARQLLGNRYFRLNPEMPQLPLDKIETLSRIDEILNRKYKSMAIAADIEDCVDWLKESF